MIKNIQGIPAILNKELRIYFTSPSAYIAITFFLLAVSAGFFIAGQFFIRGDSSLRSFFSLMPFVSILLVPALTMGVWAEEIHSGTADLLYTLPISEGELVTGKFCASVIIFSAAAFLTIPIPVFVSFFGAVDIPAVIVAYLGILFFGCAAIALGQLISLLMRNQITAFIITSAILIIFNTGHLISSLISIPAWLAQLFSQFSFAWHFDAAGKGIIDSRDLIFFAGITFGALYTSAKILLLRKWGKK